MDNKKLPSEIVNKNQNKKVKPSEVTFDRDKNQTYVPNDESSDEIVTSDGNINFVHPNHDSGVKPQKDQ